MTTHDCTSTYPDLTIPGAYVSALVVSYLFSFGISNEFFVTNLSEPDFLLAVPTNLSEQ